jgi:hypothetical protein
MKTPFWHFWKPESDFGGGLIFGGILIVAAIYCPPVAWMMGGHFVCATLNSIFGILD